MIKIRGTDMTDKFESGRNAPSIAPLSEIQEFIETAILPETWFALEGEASDRLVLASRAHGDPHEESAGIRDIREALRLIPLFLEMFPCLDMHLFTMEEWVFLAVFSNEKGN